MAIIVSQVAPLPQVAISIASGVPPYSFSWGVNGNPTGSVTNYSGPWPYQFGATVQGTYALLQVSGSDGPGTYYGTAQVTSSVSPQPVLSDVSTCHGVVVTLDPGAGYASYLWSNGSTSPTITVSVAGIYTVTVTDGLGCTGNTLGSGDKLAKSAGEVDKASIEKSIRIKMQLAN